VSAVAPDGSVVISCWSHLFRKDGAVLGYHDRLSRWAGNKAGNRLLHEHLEAAVRDGTPVRAVIATAADSAKVDAGESASSAGNRFHVRPDLVGRVVAFDGDAFQIDFERL
jgi:hypothetical protein